jgi:hypothetical protein
MNMEESSHDIKWGYYPDIFLVVVRKQRGMLERLAVYWPILKLECHHIKSTAHFAWLMLLTCIAFQVRTNAEPTATKIQ